ncbi:MAG: DUF3352 domain-containing protein [Acidobacteria bacterium]|nr:DUF3352 domain-containing protein [Acidobacteriota bacterium]
MSLAKLFRSKYGGGVWLLLASLALLAGFYLVQSPQHKPLGTILPASALFVYELDQPVAAVTSLQQTAFWKTLVSVTGELPIPGEMNSSWWQSIPGLSFTEAGIWQNAQLAVVITDLEIGATPEPGQGTAELSLIPRWAVVVRTYASSSRTASLLQKYAPQLARKAFGPTPMVESRSIQGRTVVQYRSPGSSRVLLTVADKDILLLSNHEPALHQCLLVLDEQAPAIDTVAGYQKAHQELTASPSLGFSFITSHGLTQLALPGLGILPPKVTDSAQSLLKETLPRLTEGLALNTTIQDHQFVDQVLWLLAPQLVTALQAWVTTTLPSPRIVEVIPETGTGEYTFGQINHPTELVNRFQQLVSSQSSIVVSFALREVLNALGERYGIDPKESLGDTIGPEFGWVTMGADHSRIWILQVKNKVRLLPVIDRYLRIENSQLQNQSYQGVEIVKSSHPDQRAAMFVGDFLVFGPHPLLVQVCDAFQTGKTVVHSSTYREWQSRRIAQPWIWTSLSSDQAIFQETVQAIAKTVRPQSQAEISSQPSASSPFPTEITSSTSVLRPAGIYTERRSVLCLSLQLVGATLADTQSAQTTSALTGPSTTVGTPGTK